MATYCDLCDQQASTVFECIKCGFTADESCADNFDTYKNRDAYRASWWICPRCGAKNE